MVKIYYHLFTAIGYAIYNSFEELEIGVARLMELKFEIDGVVLIIEEI